MLKASSIVGGIVASRPGQMYGWPGLTRVEDKEVLVIASERKYHVGPYGREVVIRSKDGGKTWGLPREIYNSELDDRDGTLLTLPDGTLVAAWFTASSFADSRYSLQEWESRSERVTKKMEDEVAGHWLIRSHDGGYTWEKKPKRMPEGGAEHISPYVLEDGSLTCFGYEMENDKRSKMFFFKSEDQGNTWNKMGEVPSEKIETGRPIINERSFLQLGKDHYLAVFRTFLDSMHLVKTISKDGGQTWSSVEKLPIVGLPPHLTKLESGAILLSYGYRKEPYSIRAVLSYDEGVTWDTDNIIILDEWADKPDIGYPVSLEVTPGNILTVYYCSRAHVKFAPDQERTYLKDSTPEGILYKRFILK